MILKPPPGYHVDPGSGPENLNSQIQFQTLMEFEDLGILPFHNVHLHQRAEETWDSSSQGMPKGCGIHWIQILL